MSRPLKSAAGLLATALVVANSAHASGDPALGDWLTPGGSGRIRVAACPEKPALLCGTLVWLRNPNDRSGAPLRDLANPDAALRTRPIVGISLISDFRRDATGRWVDGKIYDPNEGKTYRSKMIAQPDGTLKVAGCILVLCESQTWTRAD